MTAFAHTPGLPESVELILRHNGAPVAVRIGMTLYSLQPSPIGANLLSNESAHVFTSVAHAEPAVTCDDCDAAPMYHLCASHMQTAQECMQCSKTAELCQSCAESVG